MNEQSKKPVNSTKNWLILAVFVVIAALIITGVAYFMPNGEENGKDSVKTGKNIEKVEKEDVSETNEEGECEKLVDGSCVSENSQTYKNEEIGIEFNHSNDWEVKSEDSQDVPEGMYENLDKVYTVKFKNKNNINIEVEFRRPILETGYETYEIVEGNDYVVNDFDISVTTFQESEETYDEMGFNKDEMDTENYLSLALVNHKEEDYSKTYQFFMQAPKDGFDEYNKFIIEAVSTFQVIE